MYQYVVPTKVLRTYVHTKSEVRILQDMKGIDSHIILSTQQPSLSKNVATAIYVSFHFPPTRIQKPPSAACFCPDIRTKGYIRTSGHFTAKQKHSNNFQTRGYLDMPVVPKPALAHA